MAFPKAEFRKLHRCHVNFAPQDTVKRLICKETGPARPEGILRATVRSAMAISAGCFVYRIRNLIEAEVGLAYLSQKPLVILRKREAETKTFKPQRTFASKVLAALDIKPSV